MIFSKSLSRLVFSASSSGLKAEKPFRRGQWNRQWHSFCACVYSLVRLNFSSCIFISSYCPQDTAHELCLLHSFSSAQHCTVNDRLFIRSLGRSHHAQVKLYSHLLWLRYLAGKGTDAKSWAFYLSVSNICLMELMTHSAGGKSYLELEI